MKVEGGRREKKRKERREMAQEEKGREGWGKIDLSNTFRFATINGQTRDRAEL